MKIWTTVLAVLLFCQVAFSGSTPINNLILEGNANGSRNVFTNLAAVGLTDGTNVSTLTRQDVASMQGTLPTNELKALFAKSPTNGAPGSAVITKEFIGSTTAGSEGIRYVGALGGYTLEEFIEDTATRGVARDLPVFSYAATNLTVTHSLGDVYEPSIGYFHLNPGSHLLTDNAVNYAYWSTNDTLLVQWTTGARPRAEGNIYLATFVTAFGRIIHAGMAIPVGDELLSEDVAFANVMPSIITEGLNVFPTGTNLTDIVINSGIEYHNLADRIDHESYNLNSISNLIMYGHTGSVWTAISTNRFPLGLWDDGSNIVACSTSGWYRGVFVSIANSGHLDWVMPHAQYTNYEDAVAADDPDLPPGFDPYIPLTTAYIFSGADTELRTDLSYWLDRRFMIRRGSLTTGGGGGGATTPTLQQVLLAGAGTGGILPTGMGNPVTADQAANKGYVDSTINNVNANKAYVDRNGDDILGRIQSSILPFKTIQAAINASSAVATSSNRYLVVLSPGTYAENVTMKNYVSIRGDDIESTIIQGSVSFPPAYTDETGSEIALVSIKSTNTCALFFDPGNDLSYIGIRSCYVSSIYDDDSEYKTVVRANRGLVEIYGTSYLELFNYPTNDGTVRNAQIFEHTTTVGNEGLSQFASFNSSCAITCSDTNDNVNMLLSHDNTDSGCINTFIGGLFNVYMNATNSLYSNNIKVVSHQDAIGRTLSMGNVLRVYMNDTNSCNLFIGWSENGTGDNVAIVRNNHIRIVSGSSSNIWFGAATTTNDNVRIYDTEIIQANAFDYYPKRYTNSGSAGKFYVNTPHQNGDHIFGGALDMSLMNSVVPSTPDVGHVRMYAYTYAGLENPYFIDSSGNKVRLARDSFFNGYNMETNALQVGEAVRVVSGLSPLATPKIARAKADSVSTMPCVGIVVNVGGIGTGAVGRVMRAGRTETSFDTTAFTSGQELFVSAVTAGALTNVAPSGTNISQCVGWCHTSATNGLMNVYLWTQDTLGGRAPSYYASQDQMSTTTGRVSVLEASTSLWNKASTDGVSATGRITVVEASTSLWNKASTDGVSATGRVALIEARTSVWNTAASGVIVLQGSTSLWNKASTDGVSATGRVAVVEASTSLWNKASTDGVSATGRITVVEASTSLWNKASTDAVSATGRLAIVEANTSAWSKASTDAISATGRIAVVEASTSLWNKASTDGVSATGRVTVIEARTSVWNTAASGVTTLQSSTSLWNRAASDASAATGSVALLVDPSICFGRLTIASDQTASPTNDQFGKTAIFFVPHGGSSISLFSSGAWNVYSFSAISNSFSGLTSNKNYDVFAVYTNGAVTNEIVVWTSDNLRATALAVQNGVYVKSGSPEKKYLGTFRTTPNLVECEDSEWRRFVWNNYNRKSASLLRTTATATWTYNSSTWRIANGVATNWVEFVCGVPEDSFNARIESTVVPGGNGRYGSVGIGVNSTTAPSGTRAGAGGANGVPGTLCAEAMFVPLTGYNYVAWLEYANNTTVTFYGTSTTLGSFLSGLSMVWSR